MSQNHQTMESKCGQRLHMYKYDSLPDILGDDDEIAELQDNNYGTTGSRPPKNDEHDVDTDCFIHGCSRYSTPVTFLALIVPLYAVLIATATYFGGCISTIEKQFQITSSQSGLLATVNDIVSLSIVVFATYYGSKSHRPRVIGCSCILLGIGFFTLSLPHFTANPVVHTDSGRTSVNGSGESGYANQNNELCSVDGEIQDRCASGDFTEQEPLSLFWLIFGQVLLGIGGAPVFPLTITYLDDSTVDSTTTSIYVAAIFMSMGVGPFLGFVMSFKCLSFYVDFERVDQDSIIPTDPRDPRWIGAWWLGFVVASVVIVLLSIPMLFFPRKLRKHECTCCGGSKTGEEDGFSMADVYNQGFMNDKQNGMLASIKELFVALKRLLYNPTLVILNLSISCDYAIIGGFAFFVPKYVETQFALSAATASIIIGGISLPSTMLSNILSSYVIKRFKLTQFGLGRMLATISVCSFIFAFPLLFIGCSNPAITGVTTNYTTSTVQGSLPNLNSSCNFNCACSENVYKPVCGSDGMTYSSACRAGCIDVWSDDIRKMDEQAANDTVYIGCSCVETGDVRQDAMEGGIATEGSCDWSCDKLLQFVIFVALVSICASLKSNPNMMLSMRCVNQSDRALSIAFGGVLVRVLGFFPAPIYFGAMIANTCLIRQESCSRQGACILYDLERYRYSFIGLFVVLKLLASILTTFAYCSINPDRLLEKNETGAMELERRMDSDR